MDEISASLFCVYLRHLRQYIRDKAKFSIITDASILDFLNDDLFYGFVMSYFEDEDKSIRMVANKLYRDFDNEKRFHLRTQAISRANFESSEVFRKASLIKTILRLIKYSCTIFEESQKSRAIFFGASVFTIFRNDEDIDPTNWVYINSKQFEAKITCTFFGNMCLQPLCPITNFRLKDVHEIFNGSEGRPLLILTEDSYKYSVDNLVKKYIKSDNLEDALLASRRGNARSLYLNVMDNSFEKPYSKKLELLYIKLKELFENNLIYKDYSMVLAFEYHPSKAYGVVIFLRIYIFKKVKDVGYVLDGCLTSKVSDRIIKNVFYTKMISKEVIQGILNVCFEYYNGDVSDEEIKESAPNNYKNSDDKISGADKKEHRLVQSLYYSFKEGNFKPQIPSFILYP